MTEPSTPEHEADPSPDGGTAPSPDVRLPDPGRADEPAITIEKHDDAGLDAPVQADLDILNSGISPKWIVEVANWHPFLALFAAYAYSRYPGARSRAEKMDRAATEYKFFYAAVKVFDWMFLLTMLLAPAVLVGLALWKLIIK